MVLCRPSFVFVHVVSLCLCLDLYLFPVRFQSPSVVFIVAE